MKSPYELKSDNGAVFSWDNNSFYINDILFSEHKNSLRFSNQSETTVFGDSGDYSYKGLNDAITHNIGVMIRNYPETKEQFFQYMINS